jgi:hypothetical protein
MLEQKSKKCLYSRWTEDLWGATCIELAKNIKQVGKISFS